MLLEDDGTRLLIQERHIIGPKHYFEKIDGIANFGVISRLDIMLYISAVYSVVHFLFASMSIFIMIR